MIRLVQRNLIIPRGDTGTFSVPVLSSYQNGEIAVFSIINPMTQAKIYEKIIEITEETFSVRFEHEDTVNLPVGKFLWDIKIYQNPVIVEGELLDGTEVDSYYAAFNMPSCEIRQTGDNLLTADDAPGATLTPQQINAINAALTALTAAVQETESNVEHYPKIINEEWNVWDATQNEYIPTGVQANGIVPNLEIGTVQDGAVAAASITGTRENPVLNLTLPNAHVPTKVSQLVNDAGYLTEHQDISGKLNVDLKGAANGLAELGENGKVPSSQLPSYVDDILEYDSFSNFPITGEEGKIYVAKDTNLTYRWSGSSYIEISASLALGETSSTAYRGDRGKIAYDHANAKGAAFVNGLYKITTNSEGHVTAANAVEKSDITGLGIASENIVAVQEEQPTDTGNKIWIKDSSLSVQVPMMSDLPTKISDLTNDSGFISSYNETDPTVPAWAKAATKPSYTAAEVGAPTIAQMEEAIANVNTMKIHICTQGEYDNETGVPTIQNPDTRTFYLVPGGEGNNLFIEWAYVNGAWERFGSADIEVPVQDVQVNGQSVVTDGVANVGLNTLKGITKDSNNKLTTNPAGDTAIKEGTDGYMPLTPSRQHRAVFYGLAKAAGDTTQTASSNAVGNYTDEAKSAIQTMLGVYDAPFRLIYEQTITEETGIINILSDMANNPFSLSEIIVLFDGMTGTGTSNGGVIVNSRSIDSNVAYLSVSNIYNSTAQIRTAHIWIAGGRMFGEAGNANLTSAYTAVPMQQNKNASGWIACNDINTISIVSLNSHKFTAGTIIIYGR